MENCHLAIFFATSLLGLKTAAEKAKGDDVGDSGGKGGEDEGKRDKKANDSETLHRDKNTSQPNRFD